MFLHHIQGDILIQECTYPHSFKLLLWWWVSPPIHQKRFSGIDDWWQIHVPARETGYQYTNSFNDQTEFIFRLQRLLWQTNQPQTTYFGAFENLTSVPGTSTVTIGIDVLPVDASITDLVFDFWWNTQVADKDSWHA